MKTLITAELQIVALGTGSTSMSEYICRAVQAVRDCGVKCQVTPLGTALEAEDLDTILNAVKSAHEAVLEAGVKRVVTNLTIDDRRDKPKSLEEKVKSVEKRLK